MRIATAGAVLVLITLSGCGRYEGSSAGEETSSPAAPSPTESLGAPSSPSVTEGPISSVVPETAADLVGDWEDRDAKWVVHFRSDGTFVEDYEGVKDFRVGTYTLEDGTVRLKGDDGNTDKGQVEGSSLVFKLGTLERAS
jgi:hypothetical protein